jgi:glucokinase
LTSSIPPVYEGLVGNDLTQLTIRKVYSAAKKNDSVATGILREKAELLGISLAGLANAINPELIILGGGVAEGGTIFVDTVKETIRKKALRVVAESLDVVPAKLGNAAGFIGAAILGRHTG